jgi:hypothetical protein
MRVIQHGVLTASGATIAGSFSAASGSVVINNDGITLTSGSSSPDIIKWSDGTQIYTVSGQLRLASSDYIRLTAGTDVVLLDTGALMPTSTLTLGTASLVWDDLYLTTHGSVKAVLSDHEGRIAALESA